MRQANSNRLLHTWHPLRRTALACRKGQAMLESLIVLLVLVAALFFFYDFAYVTVARLVLNNAAARAARAETVGFDDFHRTKGFRVAMIPVAGERFVPEHEYQDVWDTGIELIYIRNYLSCRSWADAYGTLDYDGWYRVDHQAKRTNDKCRIEAQYKIPKTMPTKLAELFGIVSAADEEIITTTWEIENHASLYLKDE